MIAERVVFGSEFELCLEYALSRSIHRSMMNAYLVGESPSLPALHSCGNNCDMVDAAAFDRSISTDGFEALPPEQLATAPDIFDVREAVVVLQRSFSERRSTDAEFGVFGEVAQEILEVVGLDRHVAV